MKDLKALRWTSTTLVGVLSKKFPLSSGNCFSVRGDDDKEYRIVNFCLENLEYLEKKGINFPFGIRAIGDRTAVMHDARIPHDFYQTRFCETCCPQDLLPLPQRLARDRDIESGVLTISTFWEKYDMSKTVRLPGEDAPSPFVKMEGITLSIDPNPVTASTFPIFGQKDKLLSDPDFLIIGSTPDLKVDILQAKTGDVLKEIEKFQREKPRDVPPGQ